MKKLFFFVCFVFVLPNNPDALAASISHTYLNTASVSDNLTTPRPIPGITIKQIEKKLGRHLKFKEKIALKFYKLSIKKKKPGEENVHTKKGHTSLVLGICALGGLFILGGLITIPAAILAIVYGNRELKENENNKEAKTGVTLGWISLAVLLLLIVAFLAFFSGVTIY